MNIRTTLCLGALALSLAAPVAAAPRVAVLALENRSGDPRYDYIGGIAQGLLLYDLSSSGSVELLDRGAIDALLAERELSLSVIATAPTKSFEGISTADFIVAGEYVLMGSELLLTLKLVDVASSRVVTFSDTGATENLVHGLAEAVVERLTGTRPSLREEGRSRSILSLRDETPGSIALFSGLVDARVFLDGSFVGYTTGDRRVPLVLDALDPGVHEVSTDLGNDFGVVGLPAITFGPWRELVRVQSGKRAVAVDKSTHFNEVLYRLRTVFSEDATAVFDSDGRYSVDRSFSFVDRAGKERAGRIVLELKAPSDGAGGGSLVAEADGGRQSLPLEWSRDAETEFGTTVGIVEFSIVVDARYGRVTVEMEAERSDVEQGMHRAQR
ncbi:MAG: hypothetical protein CVV47_09465 [Spirochaetae bacterium HGW-Spirochaetae-3]|jgi:TolB-like protein|nr:MAG: hypothetical protein CVV47_09465 [Spirochaetae bacterium HGW-Spirochaetae-3]